MNVRIILKRPNGAYVDAGTGKSISGEGPQLVKLTPFVCGLIYRGEAEIYETLETKIEDGEMKLEDLPWNDLKALAVKRGMVMTKSVDKQEILEFLGVKGKEEA